MLNDLIEKRKKVLAESEQHKDRRNELNALASKNARERNALNAQTREFVEEAQQHKEQRDQINEEVQALKDQRNEYNEKANVLFEDIEAFKREHGNLRNRGIKELQKQIEHLEFKQQTEVYSADKERELIEKIKHLKASVKDQEAEPNRTRRCGRARRSREYCRQARDPQRGHREG